MQAAPQEPKIKMGLPPLKVNDLQQSNNETQPPKKMGLGLDLTKAKTIQ